MAVGEYAELWAVLRELAETPGPSGQEAAVADRLQALWSPFCHEVRRDALGNLVGVRYGVDHSPGEPAGSPPGHKTAGARRFRLLLAAHLDEIGLMVADITREGFLQVQPVGGADIRSLLGQEVLVHGRRPLPGLVAVVPPHLLDPEERERLPAWHQVYIDLGLPAEAVRELVREGDAITIRRSLLALGRYRAAGKALDDRAGLVVLWDVLRRLQPVAHRADLYAVATVQEEVGLRGATVSAFAAAPDAAIAIDVGWGRQPGVPEVDTLELGGGPGLTLGPNIHPGLRSELVRVAQAHRVAIQVEVAAGSSGTDAWAMQVARAGVPTAVLSIPLRAMHSPAETVDLRDLAEAGRLLAALVNEIDPAALLPGDD